MSVRTITVRTSMLRAALDKIPTADVRLTIGDGPEGLIVEGAYPLPVEIPATGEAQS